MRIIGEFKEFISRGNVIDLAIGVIIGAAFGKIVSSLVADIIMPPIGFLLSGVDFASLSFIIKQGAIPEETVSLNYGRFIQIVFEFLIIAFTIFILVKAINVFRRKEDDKKSVPPAPDREEKILTEIRDLLKENLNKPAE
jgi:large conductance mechanosensitive channel